MNTPEWNCLIKKLADSVKNSPIVRTLQTDRVAVIIEPRNEEVVFDLLRWMVHLLSPYGWKFIFYCGNKNVESITDFVKELDVFDIFKIHNMRVDNINRLQYNSILTNADFWKYIPYEHILIFQSDSVLLDGNLEDFLSYDFIGAPMHSRYINQVPNRVVLSSRGMKKHILNVQNGGLSLRKKSGMLRVLQYNSGLNIPEDTLFCMADTRFINVAPRDIAPRFSVEGVFYNNTLGYHAPWKYLSESELALVFERIESFIKKRIDFDTA